MYEGNKVLRALRHEVYFVLAEVLVELGLFNLQPTSAFSKSAAMSSIMTAPAALYSSSQK